MGEAVVRAINHPVGHVTQALLGFWFRSPPSDNDELPEALRPLFTRLCDTRVPEFRHARVVLSSRLIALFRVDRHWTEIYLLPVFDWGRDVDEARGAWKGFLWSPRLYAPLMSKMKREVLDTARRYEDLGDHGRQLAMFLTFGALDRQNAFSSQELQAAFDALPVKGLEEAAEALVHALEGAGEQREDYWSNQIEPFWRKVWPKSGQLASQHITESVARLCIAARGRFREAMAVMGDWLQPIERPEFIVELLDKSNLAVRFPGEALRLLDAIIEDQPWAPRELPHCLDAIAIASPVLMTDHRHQRLAEYSRRRGI